MIQQLANETSDFVFDFLCFEQVRCNGNISIEGNCLESCSIPVECSKYLNDSVLSSIVTLGRKLDGK